MSRSRTSRLPDDGRSTEPSPAIVIIYLKIYDRDYILYILCVTMYIEERSLICGEFAAMLDTYNLSIFCRHIFFYLFLSLSLSLCLSCFTIFLSNWLYSRRSAGHDGIWCKETQ